MADTPAAFGKFLLHEKLGHGGMGIVYKAEQTDLGRVVALKVLQSPDDDQALRRFLAEARSAARLRHPNIVPIHEVGEIDGTHYFTMDLVDGATLDGHSAPPRRAVEIVRDVARAIHYAHEQGIIHRDLKPANILLDRSGRPLVTDFGLAKDQRVAQPLTGSGDVFGTPAYMAPEQARGRPVAASDQYALGAVLYHLLTGGPPHAGATPLDVLMSVLGTDPVTPRAIHRKIHPDIETICLKAMEKEVAKRYPSAGAFADDCDRFLAGEPILARPVGPLARLARRALRRRAVVLPTAAALLLLIAGVAGILVSSLRTGRRVGVMIRDGRRLEEEGRLEEAARAYRAALELDRDRPEAREGIARVEASLRGLADAELEAARLCEQGRRSLDLAQSYLYTLDTPFSELVQRVREGQEKLKRAAEIDPRHALPPYLLGRSADLLDDGDSAERWWRRAIELEPDFAPARLQLARHLLVQAFISLVGGSEAERALRRPRAERLCVEAEGEIRRSGAGGDSELEILRDVAQGLLLVTRGRIESAREIARRGIERHPTEGKVECLWLLAITYSGTGAVTELGKALELCPRHWLSRFCRANERSILGEGEKAVEDLDVVLQVRPNLKNAHLNRGSYLSALGRQTEAIESQRRALELDPQFVSAYLNRGVAYLDLGRLEEALRDFDEALRLEPRHVVALVDRASVWIRRREYDRAIADCDLAAGIDERYAQAYVNRATARLEKGDLDGAFEDVERSLQLGSNLSEAYSTRGRIWRLRGDLDRALADGNEAIRLDPRSPEAYHNRAVVWLDRGDPDQALADCESSLALRPGDPDTLRERAFARCRKGLFREAIEDCTAVLRVRQDHAMYLTRAISRVNLKEPAAALEDADEGLKLSPGDRWLRSILATALLRLGKVDACIEECDALIRDHPDLADAFLTRADALTYRGKFEAAIRDATRVLELEPGHARAHLIRGFARHRTKDIEGAIRDFTDSLAKEENTMVYGFRGSAYFDSGRYPEAIADYSKALERAPEWHDTRFNRAIAREKAGLLEEARVDARECLARAPKDWPLRAAAERLLDRLKK